MIQFNKPKNLNGAELLDELNAAGIAITEPPLIDGNGNFWLNINSANQSAAIAIVSRHDGTTIVPEPTVAEKLASVGLTVDDLKSALGL